MKGASRTRLKKRARWWAEMGSAAAAMLAVLLLMDLVSSRGAQLVGLAALIAGFICLLTLVRREL